MKYETFDGQPCPGTCLKLADEGVEARGQLARLQDEQLVLLQVAEHARTDAKYWQGQYEERNAEHTEVRGSARRACQTIIDVLGSIGPESADSAAHRAAVALVARQERIDALEKQAAELSAKLQKKIVLVWRCPNCEAPCDIKDGRWTCSDDCCGASGPMPPEAVDAREEAADPTPPEKKSCGTCEHFSGRHCRHHEVDCLAGDGGSCKEWKGDILSIFMADQAASSRDYLVAVLESVRDISGDVAAEFLVKAVAKLEERVAALEDGQ